MRTAEEILDGYMKGGERFSEWLKPSIIMAINEARKEAIEECAERAKATNTCTVWNCEGESVDKQSILNLINELK